MALRLQEKHANRRPVSTGSQNELIYLKKNNFPIIAN